MGENSTLSKNYLAKEPTTKHFWVREIGMREIEVTKGVRTVITNF